MARDSDAPDPAALLRAVAGETPWCGHAHLVVTVPDAERGQLLRGRLQRLFVAVPMQVHTVVDRRLGNLTGTVDAWRAVRGLVRADEGVAVVHDAGLATRSGWVTRATDGSRGALQLGATVAGRPVDLLGLVALSAAGWGPSGDRVDVFWGSQITLAERLEPARGALCKAGRQVSPDAVTDADLADLGWFGTDGDGTVRDFAPRGRFAALSDFRAWADGFEQVVADLGSSSFSKAALDALVEPLASAERRDLDPALTAPWVRALGGERADGWLADWLGAHPHFGERGAVSVRRFEGDWVRFRRPGEFRAGLTRQLWDRPRLRALWGVQHPVERSWIGDTWIEGPELSWDQVAAGVEVGGVWLARSIIRDSALDAGSRVVGSWVWATAGTVLAEDSALIEVDGGEHDAVLGCDSGVMHREVSESVIRRLERYPAGSDPACWAAVLRAGRLGLRRGEPGVHAPRGVERATLGVPSERWAGLSRDETELATVGDGLRVLSDPASTGAPAEWELGSVPPDLVAAIDSWSVASDPLRIRLAAWMQSVTDGPVDGAAGFRVAWRVGLERDRGTAAAVWERLRSRMQPRLVDELLAADLAFEAGGVVYPVFALPPPTVRDALAAVVGCQAWRDGGVIGLAGPAAAGKSTLIGRLVERGRAEGRDVVHVSGDPLAFDGPALRYVQHADHRVELLEGPGIYDLAALEHAIDAARAPGRVVLVDAVFLGLDPATRAAVDALVLAVAHPAVRLRDKLARDSRPDAVRRIDIPTDFARKLFREDRDCMGRIGSVAEIVIGR